MSITKSPFVDKDNNLEKVYIDWPEENDSERYRFVSSRIDNHEIDEFEYIDDLPRKQSFYDDRYEDLAELHHANDNSNTGFEKDELDESVPPLELLSQTSSMELPGTKGEIDIDLRSNSEESILTVQDSLNITQLPNVSKNDLILNHSEYDSVRRELDKEEFKQPSGQNEAAIYANAQQKIRQATENRKIESGSSKPPLLPQNAPKPRNQKPTLSVAPQRNQNPQAHTQYRNKPMPTSSQSGNSSAAAPNFIELNKTRAFLQPKQSLHLVTTESYSTKFTSKRRPNSKNPEESGQYERNTLQKSSSMRTVKQDHFLDEYYYENNYPHHPENTSYHPNFDPQHHASHMNYHQYYANQPYEHSYFYMPQPDHHINNPPIHYVQTQPVLMTHNEPRMSHSHGIPYSPPRRSLDPVFYNDSQPDYTHFARHEVNSQPQTHKDKNPDLQSGQMKRQHTLYDNQMLEKKIPEVVNNNISTRFPPINATSASSTTKPEGTGYADKFRNRTRSYDRYTLRDYRNIQNIEPVGGLGPNIGTNEHEKMKQKLIRQQLYAKSVKDKNKLELQQQKTERKSIEPSDEKKDQETDTEIKKENEPIESEEDLQSIRSQLDYATTKPSTNKNRDTPSQSIGSSAKSSATKREIMLQYANSVRMKQCKKINSKPVSDSNSDINTPEKIPSYEKFFNTNDLDKLLERHEADKKIANQIREKLKKPNEK